MPTITTEELLGNDTTSKNIISSEELFGNNTPFTKLKQEIEKNPEQKRAVIAMTELAKSPIGRLALRMAGKSPEEINKVLTEFSPEAKTTGEKITKGITSTGAELISAIPIIKGAGMILPKTIPPLLKFATGTGTYAGTKEAIEGKPEKIIPSTAQGFTGGLVTGGLMKGGASIIPREIPGAERIGSTIGGAMAGALTGDKENIVLMGALGAVFPQRRMEFKNIGISKIRDYAANKANAIRPEAKNYWKREVKSYGDSIDSLTENNQPINAAPLMEKMTKTMVDRGLYDPVNEKWVKPLNKVDSNFIKSYEELARLQLSGKEIPISKVIREYQNIRNSAAIDTPLGRDARMLANDVINGIKDQIKSDVFTKANLRYADFRNKFDLIDKYIGVWKSPLETARAERFLTSGEIGATTEGRKVAQEITKETGQTLKGAKAISAGKRLPGVKFLLRR